MNTSTATSSRPTYQFTLDNGLRVIVREDHRSPDICSSLLWNVGASYELADEPDFSHIVMNVLADDFDPAFIEEMGGEAAVLCGEDNSFFSLKLPREHLKTALELQSEAFKVEPSNEVFQRRLDERISDRETLSSTDSFDDFTTPELQALIHRGTSYYKPAEGTIDRLKRVSLEQLRQWGNTWYGPENAVLSVAGDVTLEEVKRLVQQTFGDIEKGKVPHRPFTHGPAEPGYRQLTQHLDITEPMLVISLNVPSETSLTKLQSVRALQVMDAAPLDADYLGGNLSSPATRMPRLNRGDTVLTLAFGYMSSAEEAEADFWAAVEKLKNTPLTTTELNVAIKVASDQAHERNDDVMGQAESIAGLVANGLPWQLIDQEIEQLESVSPQDIQNAAKTYLIRERATVGYLLPR
ncbi:M16 family metallopeptidase [Pseudomonas sp. LB3P31]